MTKYLIKYMQTGRVSKDKRTREDWQHIHNKLQGYVPEASKGIPVFDVHGNYIGTDYKDGTPLTRIVETE